MHMLIYSINPKRNPIHRIHEKAIKFFCLSVTEEVSMNNPIQGKNTRINILIEAIMITFMIFIVIYTVELFQD